MNRRLDLYAYVVACCLIVASGIVWWQGVKPSGSGLGHLAEVPQQVTSAESRQEQKQLVFVHVTGAVKRPGVYTMQSGQRVYEVLNEAEPDEEADLDTLNLAAVLRDGQKLHVPRKSDAGVTVGSLGVLWDAVGSAGADSPRGADSVFPLNINEATASELQSLPGIGPSLARAIVEYRSQFGPFIKPEDIVKVPGIGEKIFSKIAQYIVVR